jgi:hypothetical protein
VTDHRGNWGAVLLLIGSFAGLFYCSGLAVASFLESPPGTGVAGAVASLILIATAFLTDPEKPLLDDGSPEVDDGSRWYMPSYKWPHPDINAPVADDKRTRSEDADIE